MQNKSDAQLLGEYAVQHSEPAFAEIVTRHTDLVYSAALRQTGSPELAREITQSVFTDLARKSRALADTFSADASLAGWLFRGTRFAGLKMLRDNHRRQTRERQFMEHFHPASESAPDWERIAPLLDEAMAELGDADHEVVLLRYFKNQEFRSVGLALGVSDVAAQKRVSRAVERLREFFSKRGVTVGASGLGVALSANAVQAAPVGLAITISTTALGGTTLATAGIAPVATAIVLTVTQKVLVVATIVAIVGIGIYHAHRAANEQIQVQVQSMNTLADDAAVLASTERKWQSEILALKLRGGLVSEQRLVIEFAPSAPTGRSNAPVARARLSTVTVPQGTLTAQVNSSLGDGSFRNVRLQEKEGLRTMTISSAKLETDDPQKTQRDIERYKKLGGYWVITFPYELKNNSLTLKGFPTTNAVGWGVTEFTVPESEITFKVVP